MEPSWLTSTPFVREFLPTGGRPTRSPSTRWLRIRRLSTKAPTGWKPTFDSPLMGIWSVCTTARSTGRRTGTVRCRLSSSRELRELDFGSWKNRNLDAERPDQLEADNYEVLTLERLLQLVVDTPRTLELAIETKHPTRYAGLVERRLVETLERFGLSGVRKEDGPRICVMSFSEVALRRARRLAPDLPLVLLMDRVPVAYRRGTLPRGVGIAGPSIDVLRDHPRYVAKVRRQEHALYVWTVDEPSDVELALSLGVDVIITNRPREVMRQVEIHAQAEPRRGVTDPVEKTASNGT